MLGGDVVYKLLYEHGLAHACAAEQAYLAALGVGADQVDDLDACLQYLGGGELLVESGRGTVYGPPFRRFGSGQVVHRLAQQVHYPAQHPVAHGHGDGLAGIDSLYAPLEAFGAAHRHAARHAVAYVLRHLGGYLSALKLDLYGVKQLRKLSLLEANIHHRPNHLGDPAFPCHQITFSF